MPKIDTRHLFKSYFLISSQMNERLTCCQWKIVRNFYLKEEKNINSKSSEIQSLWNTTFVWRIFVIVDLKLLKMFMRNNDLKSKMKLHLFISSHHQISMAVNTLDILIWCKCAVHIVYTARSLPKSLNVKFNWKWWCWKGSFN